MKSWNAIRFFVRFLVIGYEIEGRVMSEEQGAWSKERRAKSVEFKV